MTAKKKIELSTDTQKTGAPAAKAAPAKVKELSTVEHVIADGGSVTSKRGILAPGAAVKPADLSGGQLAFDALVESNKIVKKS